MINEESLLRAILPRGSNKFLRTHRVRIIPQQSQSLTDFDVSTSSLPIGNPGSLCVTRDII